MHIKRYLSSIVIVLGKRVLWVKIPFYHLLHKPFWQLILKYEDNSDCDGSSFSFYDRLTNGKIYHRMVWNYSRIGRSSGSRTSWFLW